MMNWGEIEQKKQKHWKRRRRRLFGPMVAIDLGHQIAILLFLLCLFEFAENVVGMAQNCTKRREEGRSTLLMGESKLECPSLRAFSQFKFEANSTNQIGNFELNCGGEEMMKNETMNAFGQIQREFPALRQISLHNCSIQFVHQFAASKLLPSNLELLNLSGNRGMREFGWKIIGQNQLKLLDLGYNELECQNCANSWMVQSMRNQDQQQWPIRSIFPIIPERLILPDSIRHCQFPQCAEESAKFEAKKGLGNLRLGDRLEMKCKFRTQNALQMASSAPIFIWPLNEEEGDKNEQNVGKIDGNGTINNRGEKFQTTKLLPAENAALLRIDRLQSEHLGYLACRCLHCNVPHFDISELRFPVPISVHIPSGNPPGERHLILHGFPLDGPIQMEIQWTEENWKETREFDWDDQNDHHGQIQTRLFFNGSLAIRPEFGHSQFFLHYFSLSIHECTGCEHSQGGGTFRFRICVGKKAEKEEVGVKENCAELTHRIEPPVYSISQRKDFLGAQLPSNSPFSFLHFLISIPPILLSLALLTLGARMVWRLKQRMAIREKLKRRGRRASRNTQRTEETSIPLDTMSRSLSLSNYIQSQLHVPLIDSRELQLNERIGKGAFGEVYVAIWRRPLRTLTVEEEEESNDSSLVLTPKESGQQNPQQNGPNNGEREPRKVAVKMLTSIQMDAEMDREAALLARLEHPNVLRMFGIAHWSGQIALVLELMNLGDLRNYLRNREPRCNNYAQFPPALLQTELVDICIQICEGLCYLAQQQIVHRDLAARNCLVSGESDLHCCSAAFRPSICVKISDFGMSRRLYASAEYYRMQDKKTALPVRWMPPECLSSGKFTPQSDIWSFGVLLFEIFTFGGMPFAALSNGEVLTAVLGGMRPEVPEKCRPEFADLMRECWHRSAHKRIGALDALQRLRKIQEQGPAGPLI